MENLNYKSKNDFIGLKDNDLKEREVKIKREIEKLFLKPTVVSIDDVDKIEQKEMKKIRPIKKTFYGWLINYIPDSIKKSVRGFKHKVISLFKTKSVWEREKTKQTKNTKQN